MTDAHYYKILGFDFGHKKIGIALGQSLTQTARPITTLRYQGHHALWPKIEPFIEQWQPTHLLVGQPLNMDGSPSNITEAAKQFTQHLKNNCTLPILTVDERLSTRAARWHNHTTGQHLSEDAVAAAVLIEDWLYHNATTC